MKQGCVLAPTLLGIFFSMLLQYAFADCEDGVYVQMRHDGKLFNVARLRAKTKTHEVIIRELLFADDADQFGIAKAAGVMAKLNKRVWSNSLLSERTKVLVYQACVLSTFLYGSESWTTYSRQERRLNTFHRLLHIRWQDRVPNTDVLQ